MIHMDIYGHPPLPLTQHRSPSCFFLFFSRFSCLKLNGSFLGLKKCSLAIWGPRDTMAFSILPIIVLLSYIFPTSYCVPQMKFVCKICGPRKLAYELATLGPTILLALRLLGLGFRFFRVFSS
jgi:hypothetical protein